MNTLKIYTAGKMPTEAMHGAVSKWRKDLEDKLHEYPIEWLHPELVGCDHAGIDPYQTVKGDVELINRCDLVIAYLDQPELYGTTAEVMYAASRGKPIILIRDPVGLTGCKEFREVWEDGRVPDYDVRRMFGSKHGCDCQFTGMGGYVHQYWFMEFLIRTEYPDLLLFCIDDMHRLPEYFDVVYKTRKMISRLDITKRKAVFEF